MTKSPQFIIIIIEVMFMLSDFYGIYQKTRNAAWQFLIDYNIQELPLDLNPIIEKIGVQIKYGDERLLKPNQRGLTAISGTETYIVVRKKSSTAETRYTIAHELGHSYLGHLLTDSGYIQTDASEYQAERFAIDILAPACVLWGLNLHTANEISQVCNISISAAKIRAERMEILYRRNKFLTHPLERQVYKQFLNFINKNK